MYKGFKRATQEEKMRLKEVFKKIFVITIAIYFANRIINDIQWEVLSGKRREGAKLKRKEK